MSEEKIDNSTGDEAQEENKTEQENEIEQIAIQDESLAKPIQTDFGLVKSRLVETEMQESYLDYAMSVIVARALPDVRDGLKPVHRRVLYSMNELGLVSRGKFRKSATVVGDVLGKYHPHGDIAVYDSLVRMAQQFAMRYPLVDGQGNFGSMDGDNAAAMRYTEARMTAIAEEMLADIDKDTVDFIPNFDGSREEPKVLPAKVPQLLLNGTLGIAVGMATSIPPHNLGEIIDGTMHLIDNPECSVDDLMNFIPAPDFPTGGEIYNIEDVKTAYATGKGRVLMRAVANIEEKKNGFRIIISEIPYQVNKAELITKIADLVKLKKIDGISDLRDESDRKEGVRIVVELKSNAYPKKVLNMLFELTAMQSVFHVNLLALVGGLQPRILTLKNVLEEFIKHRQIVVRRRTEYELNKAKERAHILEGLKKALDYIDEIIKLIRGSETKEVAHKKLIERFEFSDKQSSAILEMKLSTLAGLESKKIEDELNEKLAFIKKMEQILGSEAEILKIIKNELTELKDKYADARRTKINKNNIGDFSAEDLIPNEQVIVSLTKSNYIKRLPVSTYRSQHRGGKGVTGMTTKEEDTVEHLLTTWTHNDIMFFTDIGRVFNCKVYDLPSVSRTAKGQAIVNILQISPSEKVTAILCLDYKKPGTNKYFMMGTQNGVVKKTLIDAYKNVRKTGLIAVKLTEKDALKWVLTTSGEDNLIIVTRNGQSIHFNEKDVRPMGRSAAGVRGIKLKGDDKVISMDIATNPNSTVLTVSENGLGKRTKITNFTMQKRGGIGIRAAKVSSRTGKIITSLMVSDEENDLVIISQNGQVIRTTLKSVKKLGRDTQGVTLMRLNKTDKVASMTILQKEPIIEEPTENTKMNTDNQASDESDSEEPTEPKSPKEISPALKAKDIDAGQNQLQDSQKNESTSAVKGFKKEEKMSDDKQSDSDDVPVKGIHYNKIDPKKINTEPRDFKPVVKAHSKKNAPVKKFVPYVRSQNIEKQNLPSMPKEQEIQVKHYQAPNEKKDEVSENTDSKKDSNNYWSGNLWKKK